MEALLEGQGVEITLIYEGEHKVDGNPYQKLPNDVKKQFQLDLKNTRQMFAQKVADNIGMTVGDVLDTEAATYTGQEVVDIGFADELVNSSDAVELMIEHVNAQEKTIVNMGANMTTEKSKGKVAAVTVKEDAEANDEQLDATAIASAERGRVLGIMGCDEAKGREAMANQLASMPTMNIDDAKKLLASTPQVKNEDAGESDNAAKEALAALQAGHGQSLEQNGGSDATDDDKQVGLLLAAMGKKRNDG
ncbi:S49 family peptidase [Shewanella surugensis]|uniref:S49 family peptidase n=1 Tax=Shewanella surugensis TaxID=212020 RepID=A0ABT0L912_9GAMM|nr:S49 family peptidase [Shewanella surugensis]MCL1124153.1 S49 family peptidase [Shewanella surugensis]